MFKDFDGQGILLNESLVKVRVHENSLTQQFDSNKIDSNIRAVFLTYMNLPKDISNDVRQELQLVYLKALFFAFRCISAAIKHVIFLPLEFFILIFVFIQPCQNNY